MAKQQIRETGSRSSISREL